MEICSILASQRIQKKISSSLSLDQNKLQRFANGGRNHDFSVTYEWAHKAIVLHYNRMVRLARDKHTSLLIHSQVTKEMKCRKYGPKNPNKLVKVHPVMHGN